MPQTQALGQVVTGHRRKGHAGHQGAQPCQALHGLDVNHQAHRAALAQRARLAKQPGVGSFVVADDYERPQARCLDHAPRDGARRELGTAHRQHRGLIHGRGGHREHRDGRPGRSIGARLKVQSLVVRQRRRAATVFDDDQGLSGARGQWQSRQQHEQALQCEMGQMGCFHGVLSWCTAMAAAVGCVPCTRARWRDTLRR